MQGVPKLLCGLASAMLFALAFPFGGGPPTTAMLPTVAAFSLGVLTAWLLWGLGPRRA
jgi:hypothetical protein